MNTIWTLIFVISTSTSSQSGASSTVVEFNSKESCLAAQTALLEQARLRVNYVLLNMCVKK